MEKFNHTHSMRTLFLETKKNAGFPVHFTSVKIETKVRFC